MPGGIGCVLTGGSPGGVCGGGGCVLTGGVPGGVFGGGGGGGNSIPGGAPGGGPGGAKPPSMAAQEGPSHLPGGGAPGGGPGEAKPSSCNRRRGGNDLLRDVVAAVGPFFVGSATEPSAMVIFKASLGAACNREPNIGLT